MKKLVLLCLLLCALFLCSCAFKDYSDTVKCQELTEAVKAKIALSGGTKPYAESDLKYFFENDAIYDDQSVLYSAASEDIGEFGILHAKSADEAQELLDEVEDYLETLATDKRSFIESYAPNESEKLDGAEARRFGNYVAYAILSESDKRSFFSEIESRLKK